MNKDKIKDLSKKIMEARDAYYNSDKPLVTDQVFDSWIDKLKVMDPQNPAVTMVGAPLRPSEWKKAKHRIPMGSLDKVNTPLEFEDWYNKTAPGYSLFCTVKLDGISIELVYEDGKLVEAITRGAAHGNTSDGPTEGENIFVNVKNMIGVQSAFAGSSKFTGCLRGEIVMTKEVHKKHFADKVSARNAAGGVAKRLNGEESELLTVLCYQAIGDVEFKTEEEQFKWLQDNGFQTPKFWSFKTVDEINEHWRNFQDNERNLYCVDLDGLVVRISDLTKQISLGDKDLRPKGAIAFKFDNQLAETTINDIVFQVGNSGRITPVAIVEPVFLCGANISRASCYNMAYLQSLELDVGATVLVARCNEVIPRIEEVVIGTGTTIQAPQFCPSCNTETKMSGENLTCPNSQTCPAQVVGRIQNWVADLNLLEWGTVLVEKLVESGLVHSVSDLYSLTVHQLANLDRMGERSAQKCYDILWANTELDLDIFIAGLSIPMIGSSTIRLLIKSNHDTLDKICGLTVGQMENIVGIGPTRAQNLFDGLKQNDWLIEELLSKGIKIKEKIQGKLTNKSVCFTGAAKTKRSVLEKMVTDAGGEVKSSLSKNTSLLVIADVTSTSSKALAAKKNGTKLISEDDFLEMVK